jgi:hypothetical protein
VRRDHQHAAAVGARRLQVLHPVQVEEGAEVLDPRLGQPHEVGVGLGVVAEVVPGDQAQLPVREVGERGAQVVLQRAAGLPREDEGEARDHDGQRVGQTPR